jgi:hypothetical protein
MSIDSIHFLLLASFLVVALWQPQQRKCNIAHHTPTAGAPPNKNHHTNNNKHTTHNQFS